MAQFKPFKGIRPDPLLAGMVASLPYDVMNREEAKKMASGNKFSFLHVVRSEIDLDDSVGQYDGAVYAKARGNLDTMLKNGVLIQDETPRFYIYRQIMWGRVQTGLVGCASVDDYIRDVIKKHEFTRPEKEEDRIRNFDCCDAHTEPVFLAYRRDDALIRLINDWIKFNKPVCSFTSEDCITHIVWDISDPGAISRISEIFSRIDHLYIADGHHRSASSVKVGLKRRETGNCRSGYEECEYFPAVLFPDEDLYIMDYNRVVKDLNGHTEEEFLKKLEPCFQVEEYMGRGPFRPIEKHTFGMLLGGRWYKLTAREGIFDPEHETDRLDVSILQNNLLCPVLGIADPRTDKRIDFVGGIRGMEELERRVFSDMKVAFAMYPPTIEDLTAVADAGKVMPPKSTWFEPKLRSGLFVHRF